MKRRKHIRSASCVLIILALLVPAWVTVLRAAEDADAPENAAAVPDPQNVGGEEASVVQVANLIYAGVKSSKCFSDHFLAKAEQASAISTSRRFTAVKLESKELFCFPFVIMTGEGAFSLRDAERDNLRTYCESGGLLLASAGCSSKEWDRSFRNEIRKIWPEGKLDPIPMTHPVFHTVYDIGALNAHHGKARPLEGLNIDEKLAILYSQDGLNDTAHAQGCCCCGGNEISNAEQINVNILAYALTF